jgi:regulator of protease activity HflC (stomatin/prohibitin superfamily)
MATINQVGVRRRAMFFKEEVPETFRLLAENDDSLITEDNNNLIIE